MAQNTHDPTIGIRGSVPAGEEQIPRSSNKLEHKGFPEGFPTGNKVCASVYAGGQGSCGFVSPTTLGFAELSVNPSALDFSALGKLPCHTKIFINYKGRIIEAEKLDVGAGGKGCGGVPRAIDLSPGAAAALGFVAGLDTVEWGPVGASQAYANSPVGKKPGKEPERHCGHINLPEVAGVGGGGFNVFPVAFCEAQEDIGKVFGFLGSSAGWFRILKVIGGMVLLLFAIIALTQIGSGGEIKLPRPRTV